MPTISCSGSIKEDIGTYIRNHIKDIGTKHKDTADFLGLIDQINGGLKLTSNVVLTTMNVKALYTNIPHKEGIGCM